MSNVISFKKAERTKVKLKLLVIGPSGAGKTLGSLRVGEGIAPGKVALIDSENDRSGYYADKLDFDSMSLVNHKPSDYMEAIDAAVAAGYSVVIIDSLSHAWQNVLDRKEQYDRDNPRSNSFANWKTFSKEWEALVRHILDAPIHVIATARSKQTYELAEKDGRKVPQKLGLQPTIREGTDYEFALVFNIQENHKAVATKDNTDRFNRGEEAAWDLCDGAVAKELRDWLENAKPVARPSAETAAAIDDALAALPEKKQKLYRQRWLLKRDKGVNEEEAVSILATIRAGIPQEEEAAAA